MLVSSSLEVDNCSPAAIDDIEELGNDPELASQTNVRQSFRSVAVKSFRKRGTPTAGDAEKKVVQESSPLPAENDHFLPGRATVFVKTWGCGHNNSDGEYMAGLLAADGYQVVLEDSLRDQADLWLLNSCTVKGPSEQTFVNDIRKGKNAGKKVVVAGCVPQAQPKGNEWAGLSVIGVQQIDQVVGVVEETLKGNSVRLFKERKNLEDGKKRKAGGARLDLPKVRRNPYIEIIPINTGCLNQCTYCKTKHARGDLGSYAPEEIIARVEAVMSEDVQEIWLTSEDTGAYGRDIGVSIVDLLRGIVVAMDRHSNQTTMLRVGMTNPPYILEHLEHIAEILRHPRVYSFLHVPVQAASNKVLDDMRRMYTKEDFSRVVDILRERVPGVTIATDIICGFPTESEDDFEETLELCAKYKFSVLHISQFYPRPGTPAARLPRLSTDVVKNRSRKLTKLFESYTTTADMLNSYHEILITDRSGDGKNFIGHNKAYMQVLVPAGGHIMGKIALVRILSVSKWSLMGEVVRTLKRWGDGSDGTHASTPVPTELSATASATKGVPKLVRKGREMVRIEAETETEPEARAGDGTELSLGTSFVTRPPPTPAQTTNQCCGDRDFCCSGSSTADVDWQPPPSRRKASPWVVGSVVGVAVAALGYVAFGKPDVRRSVRIAVAVGVASITWEALDRMGWSHGMFSRRRR
ncbi:uncharacterized protein EV422DRAFT_563815 [Fimicolochytrium jonesii]|uniref:uncharacterized protein n=1 Tax=Fimicolochytrium jonesii TaxID=1396493 RepID=UPI0022FF0A4F|nr:uncharacterized protein EV422DRAFT_563815 [Fimicolochytrium jonesii]KAI8826000.1 hypothetical protein EV422DRAFT_563815 [Fimicolochytrium jonesii]